MNTKLSVGELAMVNGGNFDVNDLNTAAKLMWGLFTDDPEARAIEQLLNNTDPKRKSKR